MMLMSGNIFLIQNLKRLKTASRNSHLVIQKVDKSNLVVIVEKDIYLRLIEKILSDLNKFEKVNIKTRILYLSN